LKHYYNDVKDIAEYRNKFPKIKEESFSSETKIMATLHKTEQGFMIYAKGAVEELIAKSSKILNDSVEMELDSETRQNWLKEAEKHASSGMRIIATAYKNASQNENILASDLIFNGLIGMIDPPREEVFAAIEECHSAGINVIMVTGDHPSTAKNIALQLKIITEKNAEVIVGKNMMDYDQLTEEDKNTWADTHVFARVSPKQKLDIVKVLQEKKFVVGMTGDGINDAPALKKADIGIAMGEKGTQVAQEVADMIIKDDSFSSIVVAVEQGRIIFENIRKFVIFLLSCNLSELLVISTASIFNLQFQLFPLQILFINIITDVLPALALGVTGGSDEIMKFPPRKMEEPIIDKERWKAIFLYAIIISITSVGAVYISHYAIHNSEVWNPELSNNILFLTLIFSQLLHVFNMNSSSFFKSEIMRSKYVWGSLLLSSLIIILSYSITPVRNVLSIYELSSTDWLIASGASFASLILIQLCKITKLIKH
jgi:Ca2+-transporting ATPase